MPISRHAARIVVPSGTVTVCPSIVSVTVRIDVRRRLIRRDRRTLELNEWRSDLDRIHVPDSAPFNTPTR